jgi:hypothetical protein
MKYYNKGENLYIKSDAETFTIYEVFGSSIQKRIMLNTDQRFYDAVMARVVTDSYTEIDEATFTAFLNNVKSLL